MLETLRQIAINQYHVDPAIYIFISLVTAPIYYLGIFIAVRGGYKYYKIRKKMGETFEIRGLFRNREFLVGLGINIIAGFIPDLYVVFWGRHIPVYIFITMGLLLVFAIWSFSQNTHKRVIKKSKKEENH